MLPAVADLGPCQGQACGGWKRRGQGARKIFRIVEKLEEKRGVEDFRRRGARVEEVLCPGDLWEMSNEKGLEGSQIGSRKLGESRKRSTESWPQQ